MIGIDTNILVRYLARDDQSQSAHASEIMERRLSDENPGFISIVAMVETVWVLDRAFGLAVDDIASAVERLLRIDRIVVENEQEVFGAMIAMRERRGSFSDALIASLGEKAGCRHTLTFDRKALRLAGFAPA